MKLLRGILIGTLALWTALAFAVPTRAEVEAAVNAGNIAQADSMMREVVAANPHNARAHYYYAEILYKEGRFDDAAGQARAAREADPAISFTDPAKFSAFEQAVQRHEAAAGTTPAARANDGGAAPVPHAAPARHDSGGIPGWIWAGGIAVAGFFLLRAVMRRAGAGAGGAGGGYVRQGTYPMNAGPGFGGGYGQGYGPGYGPAPGGSALRTGLAAAGGLAAGMLAERYLEGRREDEQNTGNAGGGNFQPDWNNNGASDDFQNRPMDWGNAGG